MVKEEFDLKAFREIQEHSEHLKSLYGARNELMTLMEEMYLLLWRDEERVKRLHNNIKITKSPTARNKLLGAARLMIATDPEFSMPEDTNGDQAMENASLIEQAAKRLWVAAGRVREDPVHYDVVLSALLFGEMHIGIDKTIDLVRHAEGTKNDAALYRAKEIASITPYTFDAWDPRTGYPDRDKFGVRAYYREVVTTSGEVLDNFGDAAIRVFPDGRRYATCTLCHYWDYKHRYTWVQGHSELPLVQEEHNLPFIPIIAKIGEGSTLFAEPEYQNQAFLYTFAKSGLWERENLALTVLYTNIFGIGANPMFVEKLNAQGEGPEYDFSQPGGIVRVPNGADWGPVSNKGVIDPSILQGWEIAETKASESTIYDQALGEPLSGNAPFSMVALLHQAGRLPLIVPQRKAGWAIADAVKKALVWYRKEPEKGYDYSHIFGKLDAKKIPEQFDLVAHLDVSLPQDKLQQSNVASLLTGGDDPLMPKNWVRENVLGEGQPEEIQMQIWSEQAARLMMQGFYEQLLPSLMQRIGQMIGGGQQTPPGASGGQPGALPGQSPPTMESPMTQGLPPEMAQGGMQGPEQGPMV